MPEPEFPTTEFMQMKHPSMPGNPPVRVPRSAFEGFWKPKRGWVDADAPAAQPPIPAPKPRVKGDADGPTDA
jgi:hypothetical protein